MKREREGGREQLGKKEGGGTGDIATAGGLACGWSEKRRNAGMLEWEWVVKFLALGKPPSNFTACRRLKMSLSIL